jgi:hypothetical protein
MKVVVMVLEMATGEKAQNACGRACLTGYIDAYFAALKTNDPSALPMAANAKITG